MCSWQKQHLLLHFCGRLDGLQLCRRCDGSPQVHLRLAGHERLHNMYEACQCLLRVEVACSLHGLATLKLAYPPVIKVGCPCINRASLHQQGEAMS